MKQPKEKNNNNNNNNQKNSLFFTYVQFAYDFTLIVTCSPGEGRLVFLPNQPL